MVNCATEVADEGSDGAACDAAEARDLLVLELEPAVDAATAGGGVKRTRISPRMSSRRVIL